MFLQDGNKVFALVQDGSEAESLRELVEREGLTYIGTEETGDEECPLAVGFTSGRVKVSDFIAKFNAWCEKHKIDPTKSAEEQTTAYERNAPSDN